MGPVGVIGVGRLGSAIAERLLGVGFRVIGCDVRDEPREWIASAGGSSATVYEISLSCRRIVLSLSSHDIVLTLLPAFLPGTIVVDTTNAEPEQSENAAAAFRKRGIAYLDAPVCDWYEKVRSGGGKVVCGGDASAVSACRDVFAAFANPLIYAGGPGAGSRMKRELENRRHE